MHNFHHPCDYLDPDQHEPRHRHGAPYAAIVIKGNYRESGDQGAFDVRAGDVLFHSSFEAHANTIGPHGAQTININVPPNIGLPPAFRVRDPDALMQAAQRGQVDVLALLKPSEVLAPIERDWEDALARDLRADPTTRLSAWAAQNYLSTETISRGFRCHFGTTPVAYRSAARARLAWKAVVGSSVPLAGIAFDCGYADQAHMTRAIANLTGKAPRQWRTALL
jgi:AraC-like DNA-binding protein